MSSEGAPPPSPPPATETPSPQLAFTRWSVMVWVPARVRDWFSVSVTALIVDPCGMIDRSNRTTARRANPLSVFPENMCVPRPLLIEPVGS